jgi:hypothetical protein
MLGTWRIEAHVRAAPADHEIHHLQNPIFILLAARSAEINPRLFQVRKNVGLRSPARLHLAHDRTERRQRLRVVERLL